MSDQSESVTARNAKGLGLKVLINVVETALAVVPVAVWHYVGFEAGVMIGFAISIVLIGGLYQEVAKNRHV
jgi:hypothetical protein